MRTLSLPLLSLLAACAPASVKNEGLDTALAETGAPDSETDAAEVELQPAVVVNELQASNTTTVQDTAGAWPDWIELYNGEAEPYDLSGCSLSNDLADPRKHVLESGALAPGAFLLLWADGDTEEGADHLNFRLDAGGGELGFYDAEGRPLTRLRYEAQAADMSGARVPDGAKTWVATRVPTPGAENVGEE